MHSEPLNTTLIFGKIEFTLFLRGGNMSYCLGLLLKGSEDASGITGEITLYPLYILWVELLEGQDIFL